jgi:threonine synthase
MESKMFEGKSYVSHLECSETGERYEAGEVHNLSRTGKPLLVRYHLDQLAEDIDKTILDGRLPEFWRYRELLPVKSADNIVRLGEVMTPLLPSPYLQSRLNMGSVLIKDEGRLPTGSFKARGLALAVSMAKELGITRMAMPTNGNAGAALAAYCSQANIESYVFCPDDTPEVNVREIAFQGAKTWKANGLINECGAVVRNGIDTMNWFDVSTLKEPYRIEGKKTMGLELAEQLGWQLPNAIFYPTGGGTGLIGMWKAFDELEALGWIGSERPKMFAVQAEGCAPIVKGFEAGTKHAELWENAHTIAAGIRVPVAIGDFLILQAVRESGGSALAVSDDDIVDMQTRLAQEDGMLVCPEGAATAVALEAAKAKHLISRDDRVVLFNCATGLKYPMPAHDDQIDLQAVDYAEM